MILTVTGCYGTGSSAVTDMIKECRDVCCKGDREIRFVHDPYGISDLEYNLIENPNRHNTSHAIKQFIKMMETLDHVYFIKRYRKYFGNEFLRLTEGYVSDITEFKYNGMWHYDVYEKGKIFYIADSVYRNLKMFLFQKFYIPLGKATLLPKSEMTYLGITDEGHFLCATRKFINSIVKSINMGCKKDVFLDQLVPPSNIKRYERYFDDIRIIIVERDPRDIFILGREKWGKGCTMPTEDVDDFCNWYLWTRSLYESEGLPESTILIQFEDMIFHYEDTIEKILSHYQIDIRNHVNKKRYFNPQVSVRNTRLWKKYPNYRKEMDKIEKKLSQYCYRFPEHADIEDTDKDRYHIF